MKPTLGQSEGRALAIDVERLISLDSDWRRFFRDVELSDDGCWLWIGSLYSRTGRPRFSVSGHWISAGRWCYERMLGAIPDGLDLDHLCRRITCVNPWDVEPVTRRENLLRGLTIPAANRLKTHCPRGHRYDDKNTRLYRGMRMCKTCNRERQRCA